MTEEQLHHLATWYRNEYKRRTQALKAGAGQYEWIAPDYRVTRVEVAAYAASVGIDVGVQDWIDLFHYLNDDNRRTRLHA
jgi:hypothetical protein